MTIRSKVSLIILNIMFIFVLSACFHQETPNEKIYTILEKVALAEKGFEQVQDPLVETEKNEKAAYDKIIGLDMNHFDEKVSLSNDALTMVNERKNYMETETKSIQESEKEFKKVNPLKDAIGGKKLKEQANKLYNLMINRYKAHEILSREYLNGTAEDQQLYEMFKNKNVSVEKLGAQVEKLNSIYQNIYKANDQFNLLTQQYNEKKLLFYKSAGLIKE